MQKTEMDKAMNRQIRFRGRIIVACLCVGVVLLCAHQSLAQFDRISFSFSGGAGYVSLEDWKDFFSGVSSSHFEKDKFGTFLELRMSYHFTHKHAVALNVENIKTSATLCGALALTDPWPDTTGYACYVDEWDFSAVPIGLSYEFYPKGFEGNVSPFFGVGASYFFSEVEAESYYLHDGIFADLSSSSTREGEGYGVHLYAGVQSKLTEHLLIFSCLRCRYADGMAFTDKKGAIKMEFTGADFALGVGWRF